MEPELRLLAACQHHPELGRHAGEKVLKAPEPLGRVELVQIVDHEHEPPLERFQVGEQALDQRLAAESRRRGDPLDEVLAVRIGERVDHREPEMLGILFAALDRNPGDRLIGARPLGPGAEQHRLAAAGRSADERHPARRACREPLEQCLAAHQPAARRQPLPGLMCRDVGPFLARG